MTNEPMFDISDAAARVRLARTMHAAMQDDESAKALREALEHFHKMHDAINNSVAIKRLIEEVRNSDDTPTSSYNRTYSRHNRS